MKLFINSYIEGIPRKEIEYNNPKKDTPQYEVIEDIIKYIDIHGGLDKTVEIRATTYDNKKQIAKLGLKYNTASLSFAGNLPLSRMYEELWKAIIRKTEVEQ